MVRRERLDNRFAAESGCKVAEDCALQRSKQPEDVAVVRHDLQTLIGSWKANQMSDECGTALFRGNRAENQGCTLGAFSSTLTLASKHMQST